MEWTFLDFALIGLALLSGLLAMYRGATREVLALLSWVVAGLAVFYFLWFQSKFVEELGREVGLPAGGERVAQIAVGAIVFVIVLIIVHLITMRISDAILDTRIGVIDQILGFLFGVARGFVLILIPFMFYQSFYPERQQQFSFVARAKSYDLLLNSGNAIKPTLWELYQRIQTRGGGGTAGGEQQG